MCWRAGGTRSCAGVLAAPTARGRRGERRITARGGFPSPPYSHLMEGFSLSCLCGLIARRAADVAPSKKFCLACHLEVPSLCADCCFAPVSSPFLFSLSAVSAKLLSLLTGSGMQSEVLLCRTWVSWWSDLAPSQPVQEVGAVSSARPRWGTSSCFL